MYSDDELTRMLKHANATEAAICASLDKANNYRMEYLSGSIENPTINRAIVDILEGTRPAFRNRELKYEVSA